MKRTILVLLCTAIFTGMVSGCGNATVSESVTEVETEIETEAPTENNNPIVKVAAGYDYTVGLRRDGTVVVTDMTHFSNTTVWTDIVSIATPNFVDDSLDSYIVGVRADRTIVATGGLDGKEAVRNWTNIQSVAASQRCILGLTFDGTVVAEVGSCPSFGVDDVSNWTNIIDVSVFAYYTAVGLKGDGTIASTHKEIQNWDKIVDIASGERVFGVKKDGRVVVSDDEDNYFNAVSNWTDIVEVSEGCSYVAGLKNDGTVVVVDEYGLETIDVSDWTDIVAISAGAFHLVGLKSDGTVVATGSNDNGQCNVFDW